MSGWWCWGVGYSLRKSSLLINPTKFFSLLVMFFSSPPICSDTFFLKWPPNKDTFSLICLVPRCKIAKKKNKLKKNPKETPVYSLKNNLFLITAGLDNREVFRMRISQSEQIALQTYGYEQKFKRIFSNYLSSFCIV